MVLPRAAAPAMPSACASACGRPPGWVQPRAITSPVASSAMTAPTAGLGAVRPSMRCASRSASCMNRRSASVVEVRAERAIETLDTCSVLPAGRLDGMGLGSLARLFAGFASVGDLAQHLVEVGSLAKIAIDRSETHVGDGIEALEGIHDELADHRGRQLELAHALEL